MAEEVTLQRSCQQINTWMLLGTESCLGSINNACSCGWRPGHFWQPITWSSSAWLRSGHMASDTSASLAHIASVHILLMPLWSQLNRALSFRQTPCVWEGGRWDKYYLGKTAHWMWLKLSDESRLNRISGHRREVRLYLPLIKNGVRRLFQQAGFVSAVWESADLLWSCHHGGGCGCWFPMDQMTTTDITGWTLKDLERNYSRITLDRLIAKRSDVWGDFPTLPEFWSLFPSPCTLEVGETMPEISTLLLHIQSITYLWYYLNHYPVVTEGWEYI